MIKEIEQISHEMVELNAQVYGAILSEENLNSLSNALTEIRKIQKDVNNLLHESSLIPITNTKEQLKIIADIHQSLADLEMSIETIYELSRKFVCHYRDEWNIIRTNQA